MFPPQIVVAIALCRAQDAFPPTQHEVVGGELVIEWRVKELDFERSIAQFRNGVKATYGVTVLHADTLEVRYRERVGIARGKVRVEDPDGHMQARDLEFDWKNKTAVGHEVEIEVPLLRLKAREVQIFPEKWVLKEAQMLTATGATTIGGEARVLTIYPGRHGKAQRPAFSLNGTRLFQLPDQSFSLDRRVTGLRWPEVSTTSGSKLGLKWSGSFLMSDHVGLISYTQVAPGSLPSYGLSVAYSATSTDAARGPIMPRSDFDEWYRDSYMESVAVPSPAAEVSRLQEPRRVVGVGTYWTLRSVERGAEASGVSKPLEVVGEIGGRLGPGGVLVTARGQRLKPGPDQREIQRAMVQFSGAFPLVRHDERIQVGLRLDSNMYASSRHTFGWIRGQLALVAMPSPSLRIGVAYVHGQEFGTADFDFDRLYTDRAVNLRADLLFRSFDLSLLVRYDLRSRRVFDREVRLAVPIGLFEPYLVFREFPRSFYAGIQFRLDSIVGRLQQRKISRDPSSAPGAGNPTRNWPEGRF